VSSWTEELQELMDILKKDPADEDYYQQKLMVIHFLKG